MRFGVCCDSSRFAEIRAAGFDYGEMNLNVTAALSEAEFARCRDEVERSGVRAEAFNCFFDGTYRLTGENVDYARIAAYAHRALERAALLGAQRVVLGSGGCRRVPQGFDRSLAGAQFTRVLRFCGDAAQRYGIVVTLEPLNRSETDLVNGVDEGACFVEAVDHPAVGLLVDFYHLLRENEPEEHIVEAGAYLAHAHIARPNPDRKMPTQEDEPTLRRWAALFRRSGYDQRLSLEGNMDDFCRDIEQARAVLDVFA